MRDLTDDEKRAEAASWVQWDENEWGNTTSGAHCFGWASGHDYAASAAAARIAALEAALKRYAERDNWFETTYVQYDGWPQAVWAWDTAELPWRIAQAALVAAPEAAPARWED
jgi:hypothetical protein